MPKKTIAILEAEVRNLDMANAKLQHNLRAIQQERNDIQAFYEAEQGGTRHLKQNIAELQITINQQAEALVNISRKLQYV